MFIYKTSSHQLLRASSSALLQDFSFLFTTVTATATTTTTRPYSSFRSYRGAGSRPNHDGENLELKNLIHYNRKPFSTISSTNVKEEDFAMFCRQCEQAKDGIGCTSVGLCGKSPETSNLQDVILQVVKDVSRFCVEARRMGITEQNLQDANKWTLEATFSTLTNVNFSQDRMEEYIQQGLKIIQELKGMILSQQGGVGGVGGGALADFEKNVMTLTHGIEYGCSLEELESFADTVSILSNQKRMGDLNTSSLCEIATAGAKGLSAYAAHIQNMGLLNPEQVMKPLHEIWCTLASASSGSSGQQHVNVDQLFETALQVGKLNALVLSSLDEAHAERYGIPQPTNVRMTATEGKCILVSGHDLSDLHSLLVQTQGKGINIYTHGEMFPAHAYPVLSKYNHLVGNYGTAWQKQKVEFGSFPGPIVVTSNCILHPRRSYKDRIYSTNEVGVDGVQHIGSGNGDGKGKDFSQVIEQALSMKGFTDTIEPHVYNTVGYNHRFMVPLVDKLIKSVKEGSLSHIFVIGGCDGTEWDRSYYTELAEQTPNDSVILTLGCAKNRVIHSDKLHNARLENGLPRVMDLGQCNDSYSAIVLAETMAKELNCDVNELPLSLALSHLEQKAAAVLLTLLSLGVRNIRLGPRLPAYVSDGVMDVLRERYNLLPTGVVKDDLKAMMEGH